MRRRASLLDIPVKLNFYCAKREPHPKVQNPPKVHPRKAAGSNTTQLDPPYHFAYGMGWCQADYGQHLIGFHQRGKSMVKGIRVMERMKVCY